LKKKKFAGGIKFVKEISWEEYVRGERRDREDSFLNLP
jgi:hypothetical protein